MSALLPFYASSTTEIYVPYTTKKVVYDPLKKTGVGISRLGTSNAVSIGAYAFALSKLNC